MSDKIPQTTKTLVKRLRRVSAWFDSEALKYRETPQAEAAMRARANTCLQSAGRLEDLAEDHED